MRAIHTTTHNPNPAAELTPPSEAAPSRQAIGRPKLRRGVFLILAGLTNPCCTPLYVPLLLVLLAGTPFAVWLGAHVGWVYGGLTLVSVVSGLMAWHSWRGQHA